MKTTQWHAIFLKLRTPLNEGSVESGKRNSLHIMQQLYS